MNVPDMQCDWCTNDEVFAVENGTNSMVSSRSCYQNSNSRGLTHENATRVLLVMADNNGIVQVCNYSSKHYHGKHNCIMTNCAGPVVTRGHSGAMP